MSIQRPRSTTASSAVRRDARLPQVIEPMLPVSTAEPFDSPAHIFEVLWSGVRALAYVERASVRLQDRFGRDITHRFPDLSDIAPRVRAGGTVLDGAIVCLDGAGRPDYARLLQRTAVDDPARAAACARESPVTFQAFDLLYRDSQAVTGWALRRRKDMLKTLVRPGPNVGVPDWVPKDGVAFFEAAREHRLEGVVAKEAESRYLPGERSRAWLALRVFPRAEFVVCGYTYGGRWNPRDPRKRPREPFTSLLLGLYGNDGGLQYVGEAAGGFSAETMDDLVQQLNDVTATTCPFVDEPALGRLVFWCRPDLAATVRHAGWTDDGRLRFPVFEALRPDVPASSCTMPGDA